MLQRLKQSLQRTRKAFTQKLGNLFLGKKEIDADLLDELEMLLLSADMGIAATQTLMQKLTEQISRRKLKDPQILYQTLENSLINLLKPYEKNLEINLEKKPFVVLFIGVNGAGKTTTIGKLAKKLQLDNKKVMLAAGDTFRAAAVQQLQVWGERNQMPVIAQHAGADSAAVIFDAMNSARAKNMDILLADTAGRLHTQQHLLEELKKVKRVISRLDETAPHEVLLILDAGIGQNAIAQAKHFHEALGVTGIIMTKLDGTARGGVIFALTEQLKLPIYFIGTGESIGDLEAFNAEQFVKAFIQTD